VDLVERVRRTALLPPSAPTVVLVSGGRDSTCLLDVAVTLAGAAAVRALHVNYGLRGAASDGDEQACVTLCERLGVALEVHRPRRAPGATGNLQAWAREARYAAGEAAAEALGGRLAAAHTASDQVETVLLRLAASPGRRALLGMAAERGRLVRPLLAAGVRRDETAAWCAARGLAWREDASNGDDAFARSRARHGLLPALRALDPRAEDNILRTAELLRDEAQALDDLVAATLAGDDRVPVARLAQLGPALGRLVLRRLAEDATGGPCPRVVRRYEEVLALGAGALDLGDGARALVDGGVLRVGRTPARGPTE
jgi:tRNA(Ile)-lysidine synthase